MCLLLIVLCDLYDTAQLSTEILYIVMDVFVLILCSVLPPLYSTVQTLSRATVSCPVILPVLSPAETVC